MKLLTWRGIVFRIHPLFLFSCFLYIVSDQALLLFAFLFALLLHELGHFLVARYLRLPISQIELTPFGGAMQIDLANGLAPLKALFLSSAGIIMNIVTLLLTLVYMRFRCITAFCLYTAFASFAMLTINCLPFLPLDGGRMLLALLSCRWERSFVFRLLLLLGRAFSVCLTAYGLASMLSHAHGQSSLIFLGCYLLYASALEEKHTASRYLAALISRRIKIDHKNVLPIQHLCASADMSLHTLLPQLHPNAYHIIEVIDSDSSHIYGSITEDQLLNAVLDTPFVVLKDLLT